MPTNKHTRKAIAHAKSKTPQPPGMITLHPKVFILVGLCFVALSMYLLLFKSQDNAMFGLAMLSLVAGMFLAILAKMAVTKKNKN